MLIFVRYAFSRAVCSSTTMKERPLSPLSPHPWTSYSQPLHRQTEISSAISPGGTCIPIGCRSFGYWPIAWKDTATTQADGNLFCNFTRWDVHSYWLSQLWLLSNTMKGYSYNTGRRKLLLQIHQVRRAFLLAVAALATGQEHGRYTYSNSTGRRKPLLQFHQVSRAFLLAVSALGTVHSMQGIQPQYRQMETSSAISPGEPCIPIGCLSFGYCP